MSHALRRQHDQYTLFLQQFKNLNIFLFFQVCKYFMHLLYFKYKKLHPI